MATPIVSVFVILVWISIILQNFYALVFILLHFQYAHRDGQYRPPHTSLKKDKIFDRLFLKTNICIFFIFDYIRLFGAYKINNSVSHWNKDSFISCSLGFYICKWNQIEPIISNKAQRRHQSLFVATCMYLFFSDFKLRFLIWRIIKTFVTFTI